MLAFLRDASWLTSARLRGYAAILVAAYAITLVWVFAQPGLEDPFGQPKGTDFVSFWSVSRALHEGAIAAIYHPLELAAREYAWLGSDRHFYAWAYPPIALLVVYPLAALPYLWSLAGWLLAGVAVYGAALWRIRPRSPTLLVALAFPGTFVTLMHGQNALLTMGVLGFALCLLERRPLIAGALLGVLAFKPQLFLLAPVALLCGGHWRAILAAAATAAALCGATLLCFGAAPWSDFLANLPFTRAMLEEELVPYAKLQSVFAATRLLGGTLAEAYAGQAVTTLVAGVLVAWTWRGRGSLALKNAVLVVASLLATPFVLDYDLTLLALPMAWLVLEQERTGVRGWEKSLLIGVFLLPIAVRGIAVLGVPLAPLVELTFLCLLVRRALAAGPELAPATRFEPVSRS